MEWNDHYENNGMCFKVNYTKSLQKPNIKWAKVRVQF